MPAKIVDEFTDLPVSRQRKAQMRWKRDGLCALCGGPRVNRNHCERHRRSEAAKSRERSRRRLGLKGRYAGAASYRTHPAPPKTKPASARQGADAGRSASRGSVPVRNQGTRRHGHRYGEATEEHTPW